MLLGGMRWLFIQTAEGLISFRYAYPPFADAKDLEDVKGIILSKNEV